MKKPIWDTWDGKRARNTRTGEIYIQTKPEEWEHRYKIWLNNLDNCPIPMPVDHLIFDKNYPKLSKGVIEHI